MLTPNDLDLSRILRPGDAVAIAQGGVEPIGLCEALVAQRAKLSPLRVFLGLSLSGVFRPEHTDCLKFASYGAFGRAVDLARIGQLDIHPVHYSALPRLVREGAISFDAVFLQMAEDGQRGLSLGATSDYLIDAAQRARVVVAEVNSEAPWTEDGGAARGLRIDHLVRVSRPLAELPSREPDAVERTLAGHAARYVEDGATIQIGIGSIPDAILEALGDRRDLGVHSGLVGDRIIDLVECGAVSNARKGRDAGLTVAGLIAGTSRLYRWAHRNPALALRPPDYTHALSVLATLPRLVAINGALEVDLSGQVNAEMAGGVYRGAIGGQVDFVRGAQLSEGGRSLIVLRSTTRDGKTSAIVPRLQDAVVTTPRSDADVIVTEWGAAELRGASLSERARRMIAIAHPAFREALERQAAEILGRGAS